MTQIIKEAFAYSPCTVFNIEVILLVNENAITPHLSSMRSIALVVY